MFPSFVTEDVKASMERRSAFADELLFSNAVIQEVLARRLIEDANAPAGITEQYKVEIFDILNILDKSLVKLNESKEWFLEPTITRLENSEKIHANLLLTFKLLFNHK